MNSPRFTRAEVNHRLAADDLGAAFQEFGFEVLLREFPNLQGFAAAGKDGAIDLSATSDVVRLVVECKHVGEDGLEASVARWRKVARNLSNHLASPDGPTRGQSQYRPWYRTTPAIERYVFCTSGELANQDHVDSLQGEIVSFFRNLSSQHPHLKHLSALKVEIHHWGSFRKLLKQQPHLLFRWFPRTRPNGLIPLDETAFAGSFRSYLDSAKLPYYSRDAHSRADPPPPGVELLSEDGLLNEFKAGVDGLIIFGQGGIGKTRLTLELASRAQAHGWTVLRVQGHLKPDALVHLSERLTPETRVLLVLDYIEKENKFLGVADELHRLNDTYGLQIYYVASCRRNYYYRVIHSCSRHLGIDLSPSDSAQDWYSSYLRATVRHILQHCGVDSDSRHSEACHRLPVLAVFMAYLHHLGREQELQELLNEPDFGTWIATRVGLSFPSDVRRDLAMLLPMFPLTDTQARYLDERHSSLMDVLDSDGWIERVAVPNVAKAAFWVTAHDVLADQVVLSYLCSMRARAEDFIRAILDFAALSRSQKSAIFALERLADHPALSSVGWGRLLQETVGADPGKWRSAQASLIRTSLLAPEEQVRLLVAMSPVWEGLETNVSFQNTLAWLARCLASEEGQSLLTASERTAFVEHLCKAAWHARKSTFLISQGLRLSPKGLRQPALKWMQERPTELQNHFVFKAWLDNLGEVDAVREPIARWLECHADALEA